MKKPIIWMFVFVGFMNLGYGQTEPIEKIEVEEDPFIMNEFDYAAGRMNDVKYMFKFTGNQGLRFGYEHKLSQSLSVNFEIRSSIIFRALEAEVNVNSKLAFRHYFKHVEQIEAGTHGNNFNGFYGEFGFDVNPIGLNIFNNNYLETGYLQSGFQSRFLKYGLIDVGLRMQYLPLTESLSLSSGFSLGFAVSKNYKLTELQDNKCAVVKCFEENKTLVKLPMNSAISVSGNFKSHSLVFAPEIAFEHKIARVGLSLEHKFNLHVTSFDFVSTFKGNAQIYKYTAGIRWYPGKKKSIARGKSANNLSGGYVGPVGTVGHRSETNSFTGFYKYSNYGFGIKFGYQTRLLKNLFIDFGVQITYHEFFNENAAAEALNLTKIQFSDGLKVGFAF